MKTSRKKLGDLGESLACEYLEGLGQTVLERNWRGGHLEVDIITSDAQGLHFVEVKSRTAPTVADPLENVTRAKMDHMVSAAGKFLRERSCDGSEVFFDLVAVTFNGERTDLQYYPNAFIPIFLR